MEDIYIYRGSIPDNQCTKYLNLFKKNVFIAPSFAYNNAENSAQIVSAMNKKKTKYQRKIREKWECQRKKKNCQNAIVSLTVSKQSER